MPTDGNHDLPSTHWSLVRAAGGEPGAAQRRALGEVLARYLPAITAHMVARYRLPTEEAEDVVQAFVASKVLEADLFGRADPLRGRFRTFLLTALDRFAVDQFRRAGRSRPAGGSRPLEEAEAVPVVAPGPPDAFDVQWARQVLAHAVAEMREHCRIHARPDLWEVFEGRVLAATLGEGEPVAYAELSRRLGWQSPAQGSNVLVTANRMFARVLRSVVGRYEPDAEAIDREIESLHAVLSRPGARSVPPQRIPLDEPG